MDRLYDDYVELIKSNEGGSKIIYKGYMYTIHKRRQGGSIRWRCAQRSLRCKGSISTNTRYENPKVNVLHCHLPDSNSVAIARRKFEFSSVSPPDFLEIGCSDNLSEGKYPKFPYKNEIAMYMSR